MDARGQLRTGATHERWRSREHSKPAELRPRGPCARWVRGLFAGASAPGRARDNDCGRVQGWVHRPLTGCCSLELAAITVDSVLYRAAVGLSSRDQPSCAVTPTRSACGGCTVEGRPHVPAQEWLVGTVGNKTTLARGAQVRPGTAAAHALPHQPTGKHQAVAHDACAFILLAVRHGQLARYLACAHEIRACVGGWVGGVGQRGCGGGGGSRQGCGGGRGVCVGWGEWGGGAVSRNTTYARGGAQSNKTEGVAAPNCVGQGA
jgi:hypothetical protein